LIVLKVGEKWRPFVRRGPDSWDEHQRGKGGERLRSRKGGMGGRIVGWKRGVADRKKGRLLSLEGKKYVPAPGGRGDILFLREGLLE